MQYLLTTGVFLLIVYLPSPLVYAAPCPSSSAVETTGSDNGTNCTITDATTGTVIQLNFISGFDSETLIENDTAAPIATDEFLWNIYGLDAVQIPSDIASAAAAQSKSSGNNGTTIGAQRKLAFIKAAEILAGQINSTEPILVDADFTVLDCSQGGATLGSASASSFLQNASAPAGAENSTWYPVALYNSLSGSDHYPSSGPVNPNPNTLDNGGNINADSDVFARYNSSTGITDCLDSSNGWYYGFDAPPTEVYTNAGGGYLTDGSGNPVEQEYIGFTTVLLHEMLHGLGFSSLIGLDGVKFNSLDDIFSNYLYSAADSKDWKDNTLTAQQRYDSALSVTGLLWTGSNVNTKAIGKLTSGFQNNDADAAFTSGDRVQMYAPSSPSSGSSVSHFNTDLDPNEIMEPQYTAGSLDIGLALYLLKDIGWAINDSSNTAPTITITGTPYSTNEDTPKVIDASGWDADADGDTITFTVSSCPANMTCAIDSDGQNLTLTPASNYNGATNSVEVTVTDDGTGNLSASASFNLEVTAQNDAPEWSAISAQNVTIGGSSVDVDLSTYTSDVEGDSLSYSEISCGTGLSCSLTGSTMTLSGISNGGATVSVEVQADDSNGGQSNQTFSVNINAAGNTAPTITIFGTPYSTNEDTTKVIDASSWDADADGDSITFTVSSCPANITCAIDSDGQNLTLTPTSNYNGATNSVEITVTDDGTGALSASASFNLEVVAQNDTPSLTVSGTPYSTNEDTVKVINASSWGSDIDGDDLTYSVSSCPANITCAIDSDGQNLTLTPASDYNGAINSVEVTVTDDGTGSLSASASFNLEVTAQNDAPSLTISGTPYSTNEDTAKVINASSWGSDIDEDVLTYSVSSCPANFSCSINTDGQNLTLTPASGYSGDTNSVEITVTDDGTGNLTASASFNISVTASNTAPVITNPGDQAVELGQTLSFALSATDADNDTLSYSVSAPAGAGASIVDTDSVSFTPNATGDYSITVTASDADLSHDTVFNLTVYDTPTVTFDGTTLQPNGADNTIASAECILDISNVANIFDFNLDFDGSDVSSSLMVIDGTSLSIGMPSSGQFAGTYTLTATDAISGNQYEYTFLRAPRLTLSATKILANTAVQTLTIEGGAANTVYSLTASESALSFLVNNSDTNNVTASDDPNSFNSATLHLNAGTVISSTSTEITVDSIYQTVNTSGLSVEPARSHRLTIEDNNGTALSQAVVTLDISGLVTYNLSETYSANSNGEVTIILPDDSNGYDVTVSKTDFVNASETLVSSALEQTITLSPPINPVNLTGTVTAGSTLSFNSEQPVVTLTLLDNSTVNIPVTVVSDSLVTFAYTHDLNSGELQSIKVSHSDAVDVMLNLLTRGSYDFDITMDARSTTTIVVASTGGAGSVAWILLMCLFLFARNLNRSKFV